MANLNLVNIAISKQAYDKLKLWASVSRTIEAATEILGDIEQRGNIDVENINYVMDELIELRYSLDDCNRACKEHYHIEAAEQRSKDRLTGGKS